MTVMSKRAFTPNLADKNIGKNRLKNLYRSKRWPNSENPVMGIREKARYERQQEALRTHGNREHRRKHKRLISVWGENHRLVAEHNAKLKGVN